jgi:hypothetical protein
LKKSIPLIPHVKCNIYTNQKPPIELLKQISVYRAEGQELGPTEYYGSIFPNKKYYVEWNHNKNHIEFKSGISPLGKYKIPKDSFEINGLQIKMKWYYPKNTDKKQNDDANVFGDSGFANIPRKKFINKIPMYNCLDCQTFLYNFFGIKIIPYGYELPVLDVKNIQIEMVTYVIKEHFVSKYVHCNEDKCPGIFLEHHKFPHYITPSTTSTRGPCIVGKRLDNGEYLLIAVEIPFGFTIYLPGNCIHNDWYMIGNITTSVTLDDDAKVVFLRGYNDKRIYLSFISNNLDL